jgi:hypothetical protein
MAGIKDYSTTQANNTSLNGINTAEGMLPSNLNNAIRALMKNTREWYNDSQWVEYGDGDAAFTAAYASATSFTIAGVDVTAIYHAGRRIKLTAATPGTIYGTISSSTFSTNTTVNVTWDSQVHYLVKLLLMFTLVLYLKQTILFQQELYQLLFLQMDQLQQLKLQQMLLQVQRLQMTV